VTANSANPHLTQIAKDLRLLLLDVDGVMTDGGIILIGQTEEAKRFDVQDGIGIALARTAGIQSGIITSRKSDVVARRAKELGMEQVYQGIRRKPEALDIIQKETGFLPTQIAYMGDDIQDISIMKLVAIPIAVQNAVSLVKENSVYVTDACGGYGAVREAVEWLLDLRGEKETVHAEFTNS
jgi:3-deoxy-D-manno-octulosonate 8-phosphate phosphatase (KDO 8-P phosphatase)